MPTGQSMRATVRLLAGDEDAHARGVIERRHPLFQRYLIPGLHKISRYTALHYEVRFVDACARGHIPNLPKRAGSALPPPCTEGPGSGRDAFDDRDPPGGAMTDAGGRSDGIVVVLL